MANISFKFNDVNYDKPYDKQPDCKRHVVGAYANLARHHMTLAINTVMQAVGMELFNENDIANAFGDSHRKQLEKLDNIQKVNLENRLYRHFTFLKRLNLEDVQKKVKQKNDVQKESEESESGQKKSVQLGNVLKVLSDFTSCMVDIRNTYTHYKTYNSPQKLVDQKELKKRMGKRLTELFDNSSRQLKSNDGLSQEENEVFSSQREEVQYYYLWDVPQFLPHGYTFESLREELKKSPTRKKSLGNIQYSIVNEHVISGISLHDGKRTRYFWNTGTERQDGTKKDELLKEIRAEIDKNKKKYEKEKRNRYLASDNHVRIQNVSYTITDNEGIKSSWKQFDHAPNFYANMYDPDNGLTDVGVLYFICLFLDKQTAFRFMDEVGFSAQCTFTKDNKVQNLMLLQELMCMNRIRMVKMRIDSEMSDTALALDMLMELRKCPKELYKVLGKDARDEFKDEMTIQWEATNNREAANNEETQQEGEEENTYMPNDKAVPRSTMVRWHDRFPQMALRYIDYMGLFDDIRFQLNLGKYRFSFYQHNKKQSVDSVERLRILQKEMHGFGRIQEVSKMMKEKWADFFEKKYMEDGLTKKKPDEIGQKPYVTQQSPEYAIDEKSHSIGLRWSGWDNENRKTVKDKNGNERKEPHYGYLDREKMFIPFLPENPKKAEGEKRDECQAELLLPPQAMMSLYDLPGLLFYQYLLQKYGMGVQLAEEIIKDHYDNLKCFLEDIKDGNLKPLYAEPIDNITEKQESWEQRKRELNNVLLEKYNIRETDIPTKLRDYLCNKYINYDLKLEEAALNKLKEKKEKVEKAKKRYEEKKKRIGTKDNKFDKMHATIKTGQLAQWLIRDIWDWLPNGSDCKKELTGQDYAALQASIAMFGQQIDYAGNPPLSINGLKDIFSKSGLIANTGQETNSNHHPFLFNALDNCKHASAEAFFESYLVYELQHLEEVHKVMLEGDSDDDYMKIPFLHVERTKWKVPGENSMKNLAIRYLERPLQLPDGLFAKPIYDLLLETEPTLKEVLEQAKTDKNNRLDNNTAYLIRVYFENIEEDQSQPFYSTKSTPDGPSPYLHIYHIFKKYYGQLDPETGQKTTPSYTVEEIHKLLMDKAVLKTTIKEGIADDVKEFKEKKERELHDFKDEQWKIVKEENESGKVRRNYSQRKMEVEKRVNNKKKEISLSVSQYEKSLVKEHVLKFKRVHDNERSIRRFKTQDMLMLFMAREILKAKNKDKDYDSDFKLKDVMTESFLAKSIDFEWKIFVKDKDGKTVEKAIKQEHMKMKNYGDFYNFASDTQRLDSLLSRLDENEFWRSDIVNEFSYYDNNRSEIFRQVYIIESKAYEIKPELLDDGNAEKEWFYEIKKKKGKEMKVYVRNRFFRLLDILASSMEGNVEENKKRLLQSIRNAFSHNTYDVEMDEIFKGKKEKKKIPEVANGIKEKMIEETNLCLKGVKPIESS